MTADQRSTLRKSANKSDQDLPGILPDTAEPTPLTNIAASQLNDGQKDCLRLVSEGLTSKDIARTLNISPHTVDMRLRRAMRLLLASTRSDAAKLFETFERVSNQQCRVATTVETRLITATSDAQPEPDRDVEYNAAQTEIIQTRDSGSLPWGRANNLPIRKRIIWMMLITIGTIVAFCLLALILSSVKSAIY